MAENKRIRSHMDIWWHDYVISSNDVKSVDATIGEKASIIGRVGLAMLKCGTPAWRVRQAMSSIARDLRVGCTADIGISTLNFTCTSGHESYTLALSAEGIVINMNRLHRLEKFIKEFETKWELMSVEEIHNRLDDLKSNIETHPTYVLIFGAAIACASFAFLLGAGLAEIICVFLSAAVGQLVRKLINDHGYSLFISVAGSAAAACAWYAVTQLICKLIITSQTQAGAGYICATLFLVPGFPFITSVLDFAKLDMRSGIERLTYSSIVMMVATIFAWAGALIFGFEPEGLAGLAMPAAALWSIRLAASFFAIFGFSIMFNSSFKMAVTAGLVGMLPNVFRFVLIDLFGVSSPVAAFAGAVLAGLGATLAVKLTHFPRISITIPAVIATVPGFIMYEAIYNIGTGNTSAGLNAILKAGAVILALGLGILTARFISDPQYRHRD